MRYSIVVSSFDKGIVGKVGTDSENILLVAESSVVKVLASLVSSQ